MLAFNESNNKRVDEWMIDWKDELKERGQDELMNKRSKIDFRQNFFSNRVVTDWNSLQGNVKDAITLASFKTLLDQAMK